MSSNFNNENNSHQTNKKLSESKNNLDELEIQLKQITRLGHRIKFLRTYVRKAYTTNSRTSNLYSIFTKKLAMPTFKTIEPFFKSFKKEDIKIESEFWKWISNETGLSVNTCYSLWINNTEDGFIYPWPKKVNLTHKATFNDQKKEWLEEGLKRRQPPFTLFRDHVSHIVLSQKSKWTPDEDQMLANAVRECGKGKWSKVANIVRTKNPKQCMHRFRNKLENTKRGKWSVDEDSRLLDAVNKFGTKKWCKISESVLTRNDAQCRERYLNVLNPDLKKFKWSEKEDQKLDKLVEKYGQGNWAKIANDLKGRTDAQCRRRYLQLSKFK